MRECACSTPPCGACQRSATVNRPERHVHHHRAARARIRACVQGGGRGGEEVRGVTTHLMVWAFGLSPISGANETHSRFVSVFCGGGDQAAPRRHSRARTRSRRRVPARGEPHVRQTSLPFCGQFARIFLYTTPHCSRAVQCIQLSDHADPWACNPMLCLIRPS